MRIKDEELCDLEEEMLADRAPSERMVLKALLDLRDARAAIREALPYIQASYKAGLPPWADNLRKCTEGET